MRRLKLVTVREKAKPRRARAASVERRYRYPAEEVWEISEAPRQPPRSSRNDSRIG